MDIETQSEKEAKLKSERLKFLYEYQTKQNDHARAQTVRLDDKAAKYLTFVTIVMATIGIISRYYLFEISVYSFTTYLPVVCLCLAFALILNISRLLFSSLKIAEVTKFSTDIKMNQYIIGTDMDVVYEELSEDLSTINQTYLNSLENKKIFLEKAFKETSFEPYRVCRRLFYLS
ncbi:hypothetical protein ACG9XR_05945 [Acinetobacter guillouiae]|uniref:hypothetical protein n=1 Tax=Acinetobacter guillouiae TaxID=106649 RepID=UPI003AF5CAC4